MYVSIVKPGTAVAADWHYRIFSVPAILSLWKFCRAINLSRYVGNRSPIIY
ncbi:hypothetical protein ANSO36C_28390 [Nostoc cf. commune SO-36]|uniref:Uncharacterized protein n=1 Tax=Nostoc cf. commune SO-36 TaxID=449208 RepID=A0ABN6Q162_NOSCO|nr:hypothetical protein ANSO36C_28390 [Nostoc cf. commune SO-36]